MTSPIPTYDSTAQRRPVNDLRRLATELHPIKLTGFPKSMATYCSMNEESGTAGFDELGLIKVDYLFSMRLMES